MINPRTGSPIVILDGNYQILLRLPPRPPSAYCAFQWYSKAHDRYLLEKDEIKKKQLAADLRYVGGEFATLRETRQAGFENEGASVLRDDPAIVLITTLHVWVYIGQKVKITWGQSSFTGTLLRVDFYYHDDEKIINPDVESHCLHFEGMGEDFPLDVHFLIQDIGVTVKIEKTAEHKTLEQLYPS